MSDERVPVPLAEAIAMLPEGEKVHTFRLSGFVLIGADWDRADLIAEMERHGVELSGPRAAAAGHGLVLFDPDPLFIEARGEAGRDS